MKAFVTISLLLLAIPCVNAQDAMSLEIDADSVEHELTWDTTADFNYQVEMSPNLESWTDTGITEPGTGQAVTYGLMSSEDRLFYRVRETIDPYNGGFLVRPVQDEERNLSEGVRFGFNLDGFSALPERIRIYQREYQSGDPWTQIGALTDFGEVDGVKFVRGGTLWLPTSGGEYEVQAAVADTNGTVIASAVRRVVVASNNPPAITITGGPTTPSSNPEYVEFETSVSDPDGDEVRRVDFFDNGVLIGTDADPVDPLNPTGPPRFGDNIVNPLGENLFSLFHGVHNITAKAYDEHGAVGETATSFVVNITEGNARPTIEITSPQDGYEVVQGQDINISYDQSDPDDDPNGSSDIVEVEIFDIVTNENEIDSTTPFDNPISLNTTNWEFGSHTIAIVNFDASDLRSHPDYVTVEVVPPSGTTFAKDLVSNIIDESTIQSAAVENEEFIGIEASSGEFSSGSDSGLIIDSGISLTTGKFSDWNGGDDEDGTTKRWFSNGDPVLGVLAAGTITNDAAILEFDITPDERQLEFEFQFGSEEYIEYVSNEDYPGCFNDAFILTVDGAVASLLPDASDFVAVNTIHPAIDGDSAQSCVDEDLDPVNEHLYLSDSDLDDAVDPGNENIRVEYDGMTIRLKANVLLEAGESHRVRLVIADVDDWQYDSALFVEEDSVRSIEPTY